MKIVHSASSSTNMFFACAFNDSHYRKDTYFKKCKNSNNLAQKFQMFSGGSGQFFTPRMGFGFFNCAQVGSWIL